MGHLWSATLLLRWGTVFLGVTRYQLGKLLRTKDSSAIYRWLSGERPSQIFLARMLWLIKLCVEGQSPVLWKSIDWETGEIRTDDASTLRDCLGLHNSPVRAGTCSRRHWEFGTSSPSAFTCSMVRDRSLEALASVGASTR